MCLCLCLYIVASPCGGCYCVTRAPQAIVAITHWAPHRHHSRFCIHTQAACWASGRCVAGNKCRQLCHSRGNRVSARGNVGNLVRCLRRVRVLGNHRDQRRPLSRLGLLYSPPAAPAFICCRVTRAFASSRLFGGHCQFSCNAPPQKSLMPIGIGWLAALAHVLMASRCLSTEQTLENPLGLASGLDCQ